MTASLFKAHGLGYDYLITDEGPELTPQRVRALCHRHRGPGGDGVLEPFATDRADAGIRIWNPDGSVAEKSGNGLRIASWYLHHHLGLPASHSVDTGFDIVHSTVVGDRVTVQMGRATFAPAAIPTAEPVAERAIDLGDTSVEVTAVGTGNPHAVVFVATEAFDTLPWRPWGEALESHPLFPRRTNVQFAHVRSPSEVVIRIWERGAGETSASGSSSCAVVAAAVRTGRMTPGTKRVVMQGGTLTVSVDADWELTLQGPVAPVGRFTVDPRWAAEAPTS